MQEEILTRLDALAEKLGVAAHELFAIYVRQAPLEFVDVVGSGIILMTTFFVVKSAVKIFATAVEEDKEGKMFGAGVITAIASVILIVASFVVIDETQEAVKAVLNPEYYAISHLGQLLK